MNEQCNILSVTDHRQENAMGNDKPKKPNEIPEPEKNPDTDPTPKPEPLVWPKKEPKTQPGREPLTTPPPTRPERLS